MTVDGDILHIANITGVEFDVNNNVVNNNDDDDGDRLRSYIRINYSYFIYLYPFIGPRVLFPRKENNN